MFAIFKTGARQYKVEVGETLAVGKLDAKDKDKVEFAEVLAVDGQIGAPVLAGAKVKAEILARRRGEKVVVFKKRRRHNYRRKAGHRQDETLIRITDIVA
jgi:large subunit ribosomal protein L21